MQTENIQYSRPTQNKVYHFSLFSYLQVSFPPRIFLYQKRFRIEEILWEYLALFKRVWTCPVRFTTSLMYAIP